MARRKLWRVVLVCGALLLGARSEAQPVEAAEDGPKAAPTEAPTAPPGAALKVPTAVGLAATYAALGTWMWIAWYKDQPRLARPRVGGDGWFGSTTYAGGADKLGHFISNLALSRLGTSALRAGGWRDRDASLIASAVCLTAFFLVEVNDGFYTELSPGDMSANALGAVLGIAMANWPALDAAIDFRMQWFPSREFRRSPTANFAEDYSGQTYLLAYKPRSLAAIREAESPIRWLQFVNPVVGVAARNYKPAPAAGTDRQQEVFVGLTLDLQAVADAALAEHPSPLARRAHPVAHAVFEYLSVPYTVVPLLGASRTFPRP